MRPEGHCPLHPATSFLVRTLAAERLSAVVDIGANPVDGDPPYASMLSAGLCSVIGFEPQAEALASLMARKGALETYLADAVGDGGRHELKVTAASGMTSVLEPDPARLALFNGFAEWGRVDQRMEINTRRLDEIGEVAAVDLLKIDIQGGELMVFQGGRRKLARALVVHTEVAFVPLYQGQPTQGEIDLELRCLGLVPHHLAAIKRWPIAPVVYGGNFRQPMHQLLEADMVYVRDFTHADQMDDEQVKHLALIAHCVYGSSDLACRCLMELARRGVIVAAAPSGYLQLQHPVA